ncbi:hypothetical protein SPSIL_038620 [Sporomusa silvacetica DSM 10669]|uniref:Uncharacterized protein n=1 Tax=Sporomusa silvacetica DSM 10669 TaxID=1123289 RepID=A0ABZ3IQA7_9FIRM|nr:hypothetical protein SPSIL_02290 [Sporomusa silvacetica DSM 10669]
MKPMWISHFLICFYDRKQRIVLCIQKTDLQGHGSPPPIKSGIMKNPRISRVFAVYLKLYLLKINMPLFYICVY